MTLRTPKPTKEERASMTRDELLRSVWLLDEIIESFRWIPVGERLPKTKYPVLTTTWDGIITIANWSGSKWSTCYRWDEKVTAWMPLPEPYRETN